MGAAMAVSISPKYIITALTAEFPSYLSDK